MKFKLPIVVSTSLIAMALLVIQALAVFYISAHSVEKELRERAVDALYRLTDYQQLVLEYFYAHGELDEIQRQVSSIGSDVHNRLTVFVDDKEKVVAATRLELRGETFDYRLLGQDVSVLGPVLEAVRRTVSNRLYIAPDRTEMILVQPIVLGSGQATLRRDRIGLLILSQDLGWIEGRVFSVIQSKQVPVWGVFVVSILVLGAAVYWGIIRRVKSISQVAVDVSAGDYSLRVQDSGSDEIGFLGRFFNEMLDNVESHQKVLSNALNEISHREQNLTLTLQSIGDAVIVTDASARISRLNIVARELTGWNDFDAVGRPLDEVFKVVDSNTRAPLNNPVHEVMRTGQVVALGEHTTLVSKSGAEHHISDSAAPIKDDQGVIHGVIMVFQDITDEYNLQQALRESEQRLRMALMATEEGLWDWNIATGDVYYSARWICMLGYDSGDILPDISSWKKLIHEDDLVRVMETLQAHLHRETPLFEAEHRLRKADGSYLWVQGRGKVTEYDGNGRPLRLVGTTSDISEEKQHEEQLRRAQKMEAMGKLTGGIAHDYNNMLGVILGYAELLQMQIASDPKQAMYVESILRAAERAKKLTNGLLKFSRRKETAAQSININALLREDEDMLARTLTAQVALRLDLDEQLWPVFIDSGDLEDAILNMVINAMHAMPTGGTLTISTRNKTFNAGEARRVGLDEGDFVCLSLRDTGEGMDEDILERVFDPFFSTKGDKGTGLGLSQVYGFMRRCNGSIKVVSQVGEGAEFLLYFPRYHVTEKLTNEQHDNARGDYAGSETILVVDDEYALRSLAEDILTMYGYRVLQAQSGEDALDILQSSDVDLVLSDVIMPGINGYELAHEIQERYPRVKIQLVSGFNSMENDLKVDDALRSRQLSKPFNADSLLKRVRELLDSTVRDL